MARDDRLKKAQAAGADFLDGARAKAEDFLKELAKAGGETQGRAQGAIDDLVVGGRKGTEQFIAAIRREIETQLGSLGLATRTDLEALERRLAGRTAAPTRATATRSTTTKATATKKTAARKAPARKAPARKAPARATATKATAAKKTTATKATAAKKTTKKATG